MTAPTTRARAHPGRAIAGAVATIPMKLGPAWYPIVLAIISVPCVWLGGVLYQKRHAS